MASCTDAWFNGLLPSITGWDALNTAAGDVQGASGSTAVFAAACAEPLIPTCWARKSQLALSTQRFSQPPQLPVRIEEEEEAHARTKPRVTESEEPR
eukprot:CAMPEP_0177695888 /NCGR_PEP_ID=MMETSP0484_2-20121128/3696_1 /TAXON_ID=354590 /ORGANISM="Rhodomonas lens, Strain RHODO" /LENGTH=96 /DNA_ID=CAMNT_0019206841 /DNA_START=303 /DNA_END=590 /DNA_ORIENTATION=+